MSDALRLGSSKEPLSSSGMSSVAQSDPEIRKKENKENIKAEALIVRHSKKNRLDIIIPPCNVGARRNLTKKIFLASSPYHGFRSWIFLFYISEMLMILAIVSCSVAFRAA